MKVKDLPRLDLTKVRLNSLAERHSKVKISDFAKPLNPGASFGDFAASLPNILAGASLKDAARAIARARSAGKLVMLAMGGHPIKVGLGPVLVDLMEKGFINSISTNGSVMVHDTEVALVGVTSEDVGQFLGDGDFGVTRETGAIINQAAREAGATNTGLGYCLGKLLHSLNPPHWRASVVTNAYHLGIPFTVHVALGSDVYHIHPDAHGASMGQATFEDFHTFCRLVAALENGVFINLGSAVIMPEVFLKAISLSRNLGYFQENLTTINLDFIHQYRPRVNVVERPVASSGKGFNFTGHHEIMFPLLLNLAQEYLQNPPE
ncbi:MAG: hypothetical protein LBF22_01710 [Deltaproteobacteria bacterium]|jgi:deoxyhypusine synthase|nr:hypothetical protein [Deltaproteobacteria bacterium]